MSYNSIWGYLTGEGGNIDPYTGGYSITGSSANTEVLYNDNGNIAGDSDHTWDKTGGVLKVGPSHTTAAGTNGLAVGDSCTVSANKAVAIGDSTTASASNTFASGNGTTASAGNAVSIGLDTIASGTQSLAAGNSSTASGSNSAAFGNGSLASGAQSIAGGISATASGTTSLAFGNSATAGTSNSIALGQGSTADANDAVAIGRDAYADNQQAVAIGYNSFCSADRAIVIGNGRVESNSNDTVVISANSSTSDIFSTGSSAEHIFLWARNGAAYDSGITLFTGEQSAKKATTVKEHGSVLTWDYTPTTSSSWTGRSYDSTNPASVGSALDLIAAEVSTLEGTNNDPSGTNSVCFGSGNVADTTNAIAIGNLCTAGGINSLAGGGGSATGTVSSSGQNALAWGTNCIANGPTSIALGNTAIISSGGDNGVAIGYLSRVDCDNAICIGQGTLGGSSVSSVLISASNNSSDIIHPTSSPEKVIIFGRNGGDYDDGIILATGENSSKKYGYVKEHNTGLTWSYDPTTSGDWTGLPSAPSAPVNIGTALDLLAENLISMNFRKDTVAATWNGGFMLTATISEAYTIARCGNIVCLKVGGNTGTTANPHSQGTISLSGNIDSAYWPSAGIKIPIMIMDCNQQYSIWEDTSGSVTHYDYKYQDEVVTQMGLLGVTAVGQLIIQSRYDSGGTGFMNTNSTKVGLTIGWKDISVSWVV